LDKIIALSAQDASLASAREVQQDRASYHDKQQSYEKHSTQHHSYDKHGYKRKKRKGLSELFDFFD